MKLKFRAWSKTEKIMSDVKKIDFWNGEIEARCFEETEIEEVVLMASTGVFDKNGKEIFEGDILFGHAGEDFWEVVEFDIEEGKWIRRDIWYNSKLDLSENNQFMEIVGNIYENPDFERKIIKEGKA